MKIKLMTRDEALELLEKTRQTLYGVIEDKADKEKRFDRDFH